MIPLKTQAIQTALIGDWSNAIACNRKILEEDPSDIDALNRLAFAFASSGDVKEAKNIYQKVLSLDNQNPIAVRNLKRLAGGGNTKAPGAFNKVNNIFIEEPGKTKVIDLINVAEQKIISRLNSGECLELSEKRMKIFVLDSDKQFIGMLPDDLGKRLIKFMEGGNKYEAYVKTIDNHRVTVFVKETVRASRFKYQSSFTSSEKPKFLIGTNGKKIQKHARAERQNHIDEDEDSPDES
jgi:tetratricopeptide (TPR) repeat protein